MRIVEIIVPPWPDTQDPLLTVGTVALKVYLPRAGGGTGVYGAYKNVPRWTRRNQALALRQVASVIRRGLRRMRAQCASS